MRTHCGFVVGVCVFLFEWDFDEEGRRCTIIIIIVCLCVVLPHIVSHITDRFQRTSITNRPPTQPLPLYPSCRDLSTHRHSKWQGRTGCIYVVDKCQRTNGVVLWRSSSRIMDVLWVDMQAQEELFLLPLEHDTSTNSIANILKGGGCGP